MNLLTFLHRDEAAYGVVDRVHVFTVLFDGRDAAADVEVNFCLSIRALFDDFHCCGSEELVILPMDR
jgi:hypothetical protein